MTTQTNRQWRLRARPEGLIKESDFEFHEEPVPVLAEGQLVVRNIYLSLDPANRGWVTDLPSYVPPVPPGEVMRGIAIGVVEDSRHPGFQPGDIVQGMLGWQSYLLSDGGGLQPDDSQPAFSPDGEFIAFRSERGAGGLFLMGATGESGARVSPDSRTICFGRFRDEADIWLLEVD